MADLGPSVKDLKRESSDYISKAEIEHQSHSEAIPSVHGASASDDDLRQRHDASAKMANPLAGLSQDALARMADEYCSEFGFTDQEDIRVFRLGARIAGNDFQYDTIEGLTELEKEALWKEVNHKWRANPSKLYGVIIVCVSIYPRISSNSPLFWMSPLTPVASRHSALPSKVWTRPSSMVPRPSTKYHLGSVTRTRCVTLGLSGLSIAPLTSAVQSSAAGSQSP